jgi:hypothetical protein
MTVYGPATGNYSRDSIRKAKKANDATAGDQLIRKSDGNFNFVDNTGADSGGNRFDTNKMFDDALSAKNRLLEQMYKNTTNSLTNNYSYEKGQLEGQKNDINYNYDNMVKDIHGQTYQNVEANKVLSANRGIMNSQQGLASRQNVVRAGNAEVNDATDARNQALNDLASQIANLTQTYNNNMSNAQNQFDLGKLQALDESNAGRTQMNLDLWKYDTDYKRSVDMANLQQKFNVDLGNLGFEQQKILTQMSLDAQERLARTSHSMSASRFNRNFEQLALNAQIEADVVTFSDQFGSQFDSMTGSQQNGYYSLFNKLAKGNITYDQANAEMSKLLNSTWHSTGFGGFRTSQ